MSSRKTKGTEHNVRVCTTVFHDAWCKIILLSAHCFVLSTAVPPVTHSVHYALPSSSQLNISRICINGEAATYHFVISSSNKTFCGVCVNKYFLVHVLIEVWFSRTYLLSNGLTPLLAFFMVIYPNTMVASPRWPLSNE